MKSTLQGSPARRRLLRGVLSAPVLATVHPGAAWAQGSLACIVRPPYTELPLAIQAGSAESPAYIRVRLGQVTGSSGAVTSYVDGANVVAAAGLWGFEFASNYVGPRSAGQYQEFDRTANRLVGDMSTVVPGGSGGSTTVANPMTSVFGGLVRDSRPGSSSNQAITANAAYLAEGAWAAVMSFNEAGEAVGVGLIDGATYAVTESCWSSLRPTAG
jgi:hypothetical protein